ncbi:MAG: STM3941 family protein [Erythrobacter sp.]|uniref:STM3941 family protein n=1 Tax=Erythrobacter sp. TaxID=1042 RepID=UPI003262E256
MDPFVANSSPWRVLLIASGALVFVIGGLWLAGAFGEPPASSRYSEEARTLVGWLCSGFFSLIFLANAKQLFGNAERVVVNANGIRAVQWSDELIPWTEITGISVWKSRGNSFIILVLKNPEKYPGRGINNWLRSIERLYTGGDVWINLIGTDKNLDEALMAIEHFRPVPSSSDLLD